MRVVFKGLPFRYMFPLSSTLAPSVSVRTYGVGGVDGSDSGGFVSPFVLFSDSADLARAVAFLASFPAITAADFMRRTFSSLCTSRTMSCIIF